MEAVSRTLHARTTSLFPDPTEPTRATAALGTETQFGRLARDFLPVHQRWLKAFVDANCLITPERGAGSRRSLNSASSPRHSTSTAQQAARIVESFAGGWWSKARHEGDLTEQRTSGFVSYSLKKLRDELQRGHDE